jgi:hypothetical protein
LTRLNQLLAAEKEGMKERLGVLTDQNADLAAQVLIPARDECLAQTTLDIANPVEAVSLTTNPPPPPALTSRRRCSSSRRR